MTAGAASIKFTALALFALMGSCATGPVNGGIAREPVELLDHARQRPVPVALYLPGQHRRCTPAKPCPIVFLSPGYGLRHTDYSFIADALAKAGYLVIAIQHDLPSDPALSQTGDLIAARTPMWKRGADNLRFVRDSLSGKYPGYDWSHLILVGHSNGGDISALALRETPTLATSLITFDNRRYPLPRDPAIKVLSIRGSDFEADPGVLPSADERGDICITRIAKARHDDMNDQGPDWLKAEIDRLVLQFLRDDICEVTS